MKLDCRPDHMTLVWTESRTQVDPSLFRLGNCFPTSVAAREAAFSVALNDCNFKRMVSGITCGRSLGPCSLQLIDTCVPSQVTGDHLLYTNDLTFISSPDSHLLPFSHPVVCAYERCVFVSLQHWVLSRRD